MVKKQEIGRKSKQGRKANLGTANFVTSAGLTVSDGGGGVSENVDDEEDTSSSQPLPQPPPKKTKDVIRNLKHSNVRKQNKIEKNKADIKALLQKVKTADKSEKKMKGR